MNLNLEIRSPWYKARRRTEKRGKDPVGGCELYIILSGR
jgi:hypothetical protein